MERKVASVLFADLVGSTQLGEQDPERTRQLLDRFYEAMADEVALAGGTLEKFAGDLRPFALRALGLVHSDDGLLWEALAEFERYRLDGFAAEARALLPLS